MIEIDDGADRERRERRDDSRRRDEGARARTVSRVHVRTLTKHDVCRDAMLTQHTCGKGNRNEDSLTILTTISYVCTLKSRYSVQKRTKRILSATISQRRAPSLNPSA